MSYLRHVIPVLSIAVFSLLIYANTLENGFAYDDYGTIVNNTFINDLHSLPLLFKKDYFTLSRELTYRPANTFSYFIDYVFYGAEPWGYHLTNILLHAANGILLYVFLTLLTKKSEVKIQIPLFASLLFVSHPVLTEAVNAISFREDILAFFFYMATLSLYLTLRRDRIAYRKPFTFYLFYAVSCILYFLALLSKEMAATIPMIVYCYEWIYTDKKKGFLRSILLNRYNVGYIVITLAYLYLRFFYFYNPLEENVSPPELMARLITIPSLFLSYLKLSIFPVLLSADYATVPAKSLFPISVFSSIIVFFLLYFAFVIRNREISFGTLFFIITLSPVYNIIPIAHPFAERYMYLPLVGLIIVAGAAINPIFEARKSSLLTFLIIVLSIYSFIVVDRNKVWRDQSSLWADTVRKMPNSSVAHNNLGRAYYREERFEEAVEELKKGIRLKPDAPESHFALAQVYHKKGDIGAAIHEFITAIGLNPNDERYHTGLGIIYYGQGRLDKAIQELEVAAKIKPDDPKTINNLNVAYEKQRRFDARK